VIDIAAVQREFSSLSDLRPLSSPGGQKEVIKARHSSGTVILKLVKQPAAFDKRTGREISAVQKIGGSYIPRIIEFGRKKFGGQDHFFIIEQFIEGGTYRDVLLREPIQRIQPMLRIAGALLHACHDFEVQRIVHRDIKPENLIIDADRKIWVLDFGLARHLSLQSITPDGLYAGVGTLGYAAPEQFQNIKAEINVRADLFGVGVVLYESFFGANPFTSGQADPRMVLRKMETTDLPMLTIADDDNHEFARFIAALTQRFPSRRPQTASEALTWFDPVLQSLQV
jgi:serine/threonine-protein kinase